MTPVRRLVPLVSLVPLVLALGPSLLTPRVARAAGTTEAKRAISVVAVATEPEAGARPADEALWLLEHDVDEQPDDRAARLALVRGLVAARKVDEALVAARDWRAHDAYNLVAVRALGDVYMERGERETAERVYSSIVELVPNEHDAQRALATLLKQGGDLPGARARLLAAVESRPGDARLSFELADLELRLGEDEPAAARLEKLIAAAETPESIRHPAKQRLAQALAEGRRRAQASGDGLAAQGLARRIAALGLKGALENDVHVYLTWDTDRTDVDLWVTTPQGEKVFYQHKRGRGGEALFDDVTTGYGPESFTAGTAQPGVYTVQVNYYSAGRTSFPEARGEVAVVVDEGRANEAKFVFPYRLFAEKQTVTVARVRVSPARAAVGPAAAAATDAKRGA